MAEEDRPSWNMLLWVGMFAGIAFGAVLVLLLRDRRQPQALAGPSGQPINIWNMGPGAQGMLPQAAPQPMLPPAALPETRLQTVRLSQTSTSRLWRASGRVPWRVNVTVGGPPGSFAYLSTEPSVLNPGFTAHPNVVGVPAGGANMIRLQPGQDLYAISNVANVTVSVVAAEDPYLA